MKRPLIFYYVMKYLLLAISFILLLFFEGSLLANPQIHEKKAGGHLYLASSTVYFNPAFLESEKNILRPLDNKIDIFNYLSFIPNDWNNTNKIIFFRKLDENEQKIGSLFDRLGSFFLQSLDQRLLKNSSMRLYRDERINYSENNIFLYDKYHFGLYKGEIRDNDYIKRDIAMRAVWSAFGDIMSETPLGQKLNNIEARLSNYFTVELSKSLSEGKNELLLPGQVSFAKSKEVKEYYISLCSFFYTDPDSLEGNFTFELKTGYYSTRANSIYDSGKKKLTVKLFDDDLNSYLDMETNIIFNHEHKTETQWLLALSVTF